MARSAAAGMRAIASVLVALASGCAEHERLDAGRPGAVTPLVTDAPSVAAPPRPTPWRVARRVVLEPVQRGRDIDALARAIEARAEALGAIAPRAVARDGRVVLSYELAVPALAPLVLDAIGRRGELAIYAADPGCDPFAGATLAVGMVRDDEPGGGAFVVEAADPMRGTAPLAPLAALVASHRAPRGDTLLVGAVRERRTPDLARRTYCVRERAALHGPVVTDATATLDPRTLQPLLRLRFGARDAARLHALTLGARRGRLVVAVDREVVASMPVTTAIVDGALSIAPAAPLASISPEVLAVLVRSAPLPSDVRVVDTGASPFVPGTQRLPASNSRVPP